MAASQLHIRMPSSWRSPDIVASIRNDREIKKDVEAKLVAFLDNFLKSFG